MNTKLFVLFLLFSTIGSSLVVSAKKQGQELIDSLQSRLNAVNNDTNKVNLLNDLSFAYRSINADSGIIIGLQSLTLAKQLDWKKGYAWAHNSIALNYMAKSDYPRTLEYLYKELRLQEERGDQSDISIVLGNIGNVYYVQGAHDKALDFYSRALSTARAAGNRRSELTTLSGIGNVYHQTGNYKMAIHYLDSTVTLAQRLKDYENVARNLGNLANEYSMLKNYAMALDGNFKALDIARRYGFKTVCAVTLGNIGETYLAMAKDSSSRNHGALSQAIRFLDSGIVGCKGLGYLAPMSEFSSQLSEAYSLGGNYKSALATYQEFVTYKDSVYSIANKIKITNLETKREIELRNKQIEIDRLAVAKKRNERGFFFVGMALLLAVILVVFRNYRVQKVLNGALSIEKKKVEIHTEELDATNKELITTLADLKETQEQLIVVEKQKENEMIRSRISQDIHDDISSELTRISWVSELAKAKVKKEDFGDMAGLLEKITDSSRETVTKLGEIIWTVNPKNDSLASLLAYMRTHISKFFADTAIKCKIEFQDAGTDIPINPELKRNLYLVMKEALNNTLKYSGATQVTIAFVLTGENYCFSVTDDGKGIDEGIIQGGGNGLGNMRKRMESVLGVCEISSTPGAGTSVCYSGNMY